MRAMKETKEASSTEWAGADGAEKDTSSYELETMLYARHVELENLDDLTLQRGTPIPALFNQFYKFVQNPSSVSIETFKRMGDTDDTIGSCTELLMTCLAARLGRYQHPSEEITEWMNTALEGIDGGWYAAVKGLLSAVWAGFAVDEVVWANKENGFVPEKLVSLPPSTVLFETDRTGEITSDGILQYQRNYNPQVLSQGIGFFGGPVGSGFGFVDAVRPDLFAKMGDLPFPMRTANTFNYLSIRIPKAKCIHYAFDTLGKFGNPYGKSLLRRAYKYYVTKDEVLRMMAIALDRKGTPLTVIFADPNTTIRDDQQQQGLANAKGLKAGIRADVAAQRAFQNVHNDSTIILPGKRDQIFGIEKLDQSSNAQDFIAALDFCNKSIMRAMLVPSLIFGNGDGTGSYSLGQEHARTFEKILDGILSGITNVMLQQLIKPMLALNFPRETWEKEGLGDFAKRELTQDERDKEMEVMEKGVNIGAIDMNDLNDLNAIREKMGFEARETLIEQQDMFRPFDSKGNPTGEGDEQSGDSGQFGNSEEFDGDKDASKKKKAEPKKNGKPFEKKG